VFDLADELKLGEEVEMEVEVKEKGKELDRLFSRFPLKAAKEVSKSLSFLSSFPFFPSSFLFLRY